MKPTLIVAALLFSLSFVLFAGLKPNFVVIFCDDQTYRAIGYNNPVVQTPNMDRLAAEGMLFDRAFIASPICVASRASIYTGAFPQQHGAVALSTEGFQKSVIEEKRFVTLPMVLAQAGYHTAHYGKSHLGPPTRYGFAEGREIGDVNDVETFAEAGKFLKREAKSARPFLLWLTPRNPHVPYTAPQRFLELYKDAEITLDPNWAETPPLVSFFNQAGTGEILFRDSSYKINDHAPAGLTAGPPRSAPVMKEVIKAYYAEISFLDEQVGTLVQQLKDAGLYENTILIYLSDNGYLLGNHGLGNKLTMHEESVRVPMFMHSPLLPVKHSRTDALVSSLDIFPTLLDFAGAAAPSQLMGKSLRPVIQAPGAKVRDYVVSESVGPPENRVGTGHRMVRTDHFKYMLSTSDEQAFFDLRTDPYEMKNLVADPALKEEIERHRAMLREWSASVGEKRMTVEEAVKTQPSAAKDPKPAKKGKAKMKVP